MSDAAKQSWRKTKLGSLATKLVNGGTPPTDVPHFWQGRYPWITGADFTESGIGPIRRFVSDDAISQTATNLINRGQLLIVTRTGVGKLAIAPTDIAISQDITGFYIDGEQATAEFLYHRLKLGLEDLKKLNQGTSINGITRGDLIGYSLEIPPPPQQRRIATILTTLDEVIEATEKLVEKHQQIKAGLMHDLFTRGLWTRPELARGDHKGLPSEASAKEGQLRPTPEEAPGLYQNSPLGLIPKAWKLSSIGEIAESVADGPFGSNLKTEHYVVEPGVRVVRLQNIHDTIYNDEDRAFVSESHANYLIRNQVVSGDILVAGLGEDKHVVARACCYPYGLPPAINKADCFRLRCDSEKALNSFVMFYLNTSIARGQARRYEQGVTRRRINGGNLKRILFGLPSLPEQKKAIAMLDSAGSDIDSITEQVAKLRQQKQGLMHDLLTGRVRVDGERGFDSQS